MTGEMSESEGMVERKLQLLRSSEDGTAKRLLWRLSRIHNPLQLAMEVELMAVATGCTRGRVSGQEIADRHHVSRQTVHQHMKKVCAFLGVDNPLARKTK